MKQFWWFNLITKRNIVNIYTRSVVWMSDFNYNWGADTDDASALASIGGIERKANFYPLVFAFKLTLHRAVEGRCTRQTIDFFCSIFFRCGFFSMCEPRLKHSHKFNWNAKAPFMESNVFGKFHCLNDQRFIWFPIVFSRLNQWKIRLKFHRWEKICVAHMVI
jgi:hypothetical protein